MIIVNQDKTEIINFDKVQNIYVSSRYISLNFELNNNEVVGTYETEERAKEVLEEISERLENWENLKAGQPTGVCSYRYIMPKE